MITRKLITSIIKIMKMIKITRKISIGIKITVKLLEGVIKVIIPYNYPTTLSLFPQQLRIYTSND